MVGLPPAPPPICFAATSRSSGAVTPRSTSRGLQAATIERLPVRVGAEDDGRAAVTLQLADHLLRQLSELVGVDLLERRHQPRTVDVGRLLHDLIDTGRDVTLAELAELGLQPLDPLDELACALDRGRRVGAPERRDQAPGAARAPR